MTGVFKNILVPVDFSNGTAQSLRHALAMAEITGGRVELLHVLESPDMLDEHMPTEERSGVAGRLREHAAQRLARLKESLVREGGFAPGATVETSLRSGNPALAVIEHAVEKETDLIVMSAREHGGWSGMFRLTTLETVVRHSGCAVLVLKTGDEIDETEWLHYELASDLDYELKVSRVLFASDLSDGSFGALDTLLPFAETVQCKLDVVHVVDDLSSYPLIDWAVLGVSSPDEWLPRLVASAEERLRACMAARTGHLPWTESRVLTGRPARRICDLAADEGYDMIAMSSHGRGGFVTTILGSVTERVIRSSRVPVLVLPAAGQEGVVRGERRKSHPPE